jgi:hypothetical protein
MALVAIADLLLSVSKTDVSLATYAGSSHVAF